MTDRRAALAVLAALRKSPVGDTAVLVGSSGLFGFETEVPALTEDPLRIEDLRAGAQDAFLALERDPLFTDAGAEGYAPVLKQAEAGLAGLFTMLDQIHA